MEAFQIARFFPLAMPILSAANQWVLVVVLGQPHTLKFVKKLTAIQPSLVRLNDFDQTISETSHSLDDCDRLSCSRLLLHPLQSVDTK